MGVRDKLDEYTEAARALALFDAIHEDVVKNRILLQKATEDKLKALKAEAHACHEGASNRYFEVALQEKVRRWYDADTLVSNAPSVLELQGVITQVADKDLIDHYVKIGVIDKEVAQDAERSEPMTPACSIRQKVHFGTSMVKKAAKAVIKKEVK